MQHRELNAAHLDDRPLDQLDLRCLAGTQRAGENGKAAQRVGQHGRIVRMHGQGRSGSLNQGFVGHNMVKMAVRVGDHLDRPLVPLDGIRDQRGISARVDDDGFAALVVGHDVAVGLQVAYGEGLDAHRGLLNRAGTDYGWEYTIEPRSPQPLPLTEQRIEV